MLNHILNTIMVMFFIPIMANNIQTHFQKANQAPSQSNKILNYISLTGILYAYGYSSLLVVNLVINWLQFVHINNSILQILICGISVGSIIATFLSSSTIKLKHRQIQLSQFKFIKIFGVIGLMLLILTFIHITYLIIIIQN